MLGPVPFCASQSGQFACHQSPVGAAVIAVTSERQLIWLLQQRRRRVALAGGRVFHSRILPDRAKPLDAAAHSISVFWRTDAHDQER